MASEKSTQFVSFVLNGIHNDNKALRAKLSRADSESTEYQCWDVLSRWVDLEKEADRKAYGLIGSSLARARPLQNGSIGLGRGLFVSLKEGNASEPDSARLRRVLACRESIELIGVLRSVLRLLDSKGVVLDYARLLDEVYWFNSEASRERTKARWAQEFFGRKEEE